MWISRTICLFFVYSLMGWVYETIFCTVKTKKWENRGFLYGPVCPIYGSGAVAITLITQLLPPLTGLPFGVEVLRICLIAFFGSMVLEYGTSWILEKLFHAVWWDYHDMPFNLHGRISLFSSLGFGVAGPIVVFFVIPPVTAVISMLSPIMTEFLALVFTIIGTADVTLTVSALTDFERDVVQAQEAFNDRMDALVENVQTSMGAARQAAVRRVKGFRYPKLATESLTGLVEAIRNRF